MLISFQCLVFSIFMFAIGLWGIVLNSNNVIILIMAVEILLLGASLNFIFFSIFMDDLNGQVFSLLILTVAASESAIGLAILVIFYNNHQNIDFDFIYGLRG